ncbi:hypothetical protein GC176_08550 [bacterium]|nr:hypothetical protein [bacterium]
MTVRPQRFQLKRAVYAAAVTTLAVTLILILPQPTAAQQAAPALNQNALTFLSQPDWQFRLDLFQLMLAQRNVAVTRSGDDILNRPDESIIILIGDLERVPTALRLQLQSFIQRGGALLAASDLDASLPGLFTIRSGPVQASDPRLQYEGFSDCPRVTRLNPNHELTAGVMELIANRCGWIDSLSPQLGERTEVAALPNRVQAPRGVPSGKSLIATLVSRDSRYGRMAVIADHSLLISGMLLHGDNSIFAVNLVNWLCAGRRRQALILVHGDLIQGGGLQLSPELLPPNMAGQPPSLDDVSRLPRETLLEFANHFVTGIEDANLPNELATGYFSSLQQPYYFRLLYLVAAVCGAIWLLRQFFRRGNEQLSSVERLNGPLALQRVQSMINSDDYSIAIRELSRHLFRQLTGSDAARDWPMAFRELQVDGSFLQKMSIARHLIVLRRLATGNNSSWLSRRHFLKLAGMIERLLTLHASGQLRVRSSEGG